MPFHGAHKLLIPHFVLRKLGVCVGRPYCHQSAGELVSYLTGELMFSKIVKVYLVFCKLFWKKLQNVYTSQWKCYEYVVIRCVYVVTRCVCACVHVVRWPWRSRYTTMSMWRWRCDDGVNVLWCCSHLVWLVFEDPSLHVLVFLLKTFLWLVPTVLLFFFCFVFGIVFRNGKREERWEKKARGRCAVCKVWK